MLRQVFALTRKEIQLWLQRPGQWAVIFLTPLLFVAVMGQVFGSGGAPTVAVYAVNEDKGRAGLQVMDSLDDAKTLDISTLESRSEADRRIAQGQRMAAIIVPAGFSDALLTDAGGKIEVIVDPAREEQAGIVVGQVQASTASLLIDAEVTRGVTQAFDDPGSLFGTTGITLDTGSLDMEAIQKFLTAALKGVIASQVQDAVDDPLVRVQRTAAGEVDPAALPPTLLDYLVPGYTLFFAFFLVGLMAEVILAERVSGAFRRLLSMPATRAAILLGKIVPYFLAVLVQIVTVMGLCTLVFDFDLGRSPLAFTMVTLSTAAALVGLGIMVAALVRTEGQVSAVSDLIAIGAAVASGAMFPSIRVAGLELLTPHHWAISGFQDVISRDLGPAAVLTESAALCAMAALFFVIGVWRFKYD